MSFTRNLIIITVSTASLSFVASTIMAIAIVRSDGGLSSPYQRIIFGLCLSDILQSCSLIVGPFAVPSSQPQGLWAGGNYQTCQANGFLFNFGSLSTPMYMFALCIYTALKIKRNMSDKMFSQKIEKAIHPIIILVAFSICVAGLATKSINSAVVGTYCTFTAVPVGCRQYPDIFGECDPAIAKSAVILSLLGTIVIPSFCLFGIICCTGIVCQHVLDIDGNLYGEPLMRRSGAIEKEIRIPTPLRSTDESQPSGETNLLRYPSSEQGKSDYIEKEIRIPTPLRSTDESQPSGETNVLRYPSSEKRKSDCSGSSRSRVTGVVKEFNLTKTDNPKIQEYDPGLEGLEIEVHRALDGKKAIRKAALYRRVILHQAILFGLAYIIAYVFFWIVLISFLAGKQPSFGITYIAAFFYPIGGFFYIIVYARPKASFYRIENSECSWMQAFWIVIMAGVDSPKRNVGSVDRNFIVASRNRRLSKVSKISSGGVIYNGSIYLSEDNGTHESASELVFAVGGLSYLEDIVENFSEDNGSHHITSEPIRVDGELSNLEDIAEEDESNTIANHL